MHAHRTSSEATAETIFSLYGDGRNSWYSTNAQSLTPSRVCKPMSTTNGDPSLSILDEVQRAQDRRQIKGYRSRGRETAPVGVYRVDGDYTPYITTYSIVVRLPTNPAARTQLPRNSSQDRSPPSSILSKPPSLSGLPGSSVGAPTITQYPSAAPDRQTPAPAHQSPPQRPHVTLQVNFNLPLHIRSSPSTSIAPPSPARPHARGENPNSYHIRAIYAAFDVSSVRGDGHEDGKEPTRARLGNDHSLAFTWPFSPRRKTNYRREGDIKPR